MDIQFNDNGLEQTLSRRFKEKYPRAVASALNKAAKNAREALVREEKSELHIVKNFLPNSTQYEAARSAHNPIQAVVGILDRVNFAERLVDGGTRTPERSRYIAVPFKIRRGRSGSITRAMKPSAVLNNTRLNAFVKEINGTLGIWGVWEGQLSLLYILKPATEYNEAPYIDFEEVVFESAKRNDFEEDCMKAILKALNL